MKTFVQQCEQLVETSRLVRLVYGQAAKDTYGRILGSSQDFLRIKEELTGDIFNIPWAHVDAVVEVERAGKS